MKCDPLISVIVPAYNAELTIEETLGSVMNQSYKNIEIIVVDDESTDQTCEVVEQLRHVDRRIKLERKENGGPASARNYGIAAATGEFVAPIDADDLWHPRKLEIQLAALQAAGDSYGFAYSPCRLIDGASNVFRTLPLYHLNGNSFYQLCYYNFTQNGSSLLVTMDACRAVGGYDERKCVIGREDILFALNLAAKYKVACVPEYLVGYRQLDSSLSSDNKKMHYAGIEVMETLCETRPVNRKTYNWATNPSRIRWMYQNLKESGINLLSIRLLFASLFYDPRATLHSAKVGLLSSLGMHKTVGETKSFKSYDITCPADESLPSYVIDRLNWLASMDCRSKV